MIYLCQSRTFSASVVHFSMGSECMATLVCIMSAHIARGFSANACKCVCLLLAKKCRFWSRNSGAICVCAVQCLSTTMSILDWYIDLYACPRRKSANRLAWYITRVPLIYGHSLGRIYHDQASVSLSAPTASEPTLQAVRQQPLPLLAFLLILLPMPWNLPSFLRQRSTRSSQQPSLDFLSLLSSSPLFGIISH